MNIQTVAENLRNTIAGKERLLIKNELRLKEVKMDMIDRIVCESVTKMLRLNIDELRRILQDVEQCVEEFEVLKDDLAETNGRVRQLERQASDDSWITNPDRMGGCYSEDEMRNEGWK